MKYYIATKLENWQEHNDLRDILNGRGHSITYDWTDHNAIWHEGLQRCREVSILEADGVRDADLVIVLWPGGRGTHAEMGIAIGCGVPIVFVSDVDGHHRADPEVCAFYYHPTVIARFRTVNGFMASWDSIESLVEAVK